MYVYIYIMIYIYIYPCPYLFFLAILNYFDLFPEDKSQPCASGRTWCASLPRALLPSAWKDLWICHKPSSIQWPCWPGTD